MAILARDPKALDRARLILVGRGRDEAVIVVSCDVADKDQVDGAFEVVRKKFGPVDVLVNNAGLITVGPMESMTLDDYRESLDLYFWAPVYTTLAVLPEMRLRKQGRIVNISSIGGKSVFRICCLTVQGNVLWLDFPEELELKSRKTIYASRQSIRG